MVKQRRNNAFVSVLGAYFAEILNIPASCFISFQGMILNPINLMITYKFFYFYFRQNRVNIYCRNLKRNEK